MIARILDILALAADRLIARVFPAPPQRLPEAEFVVPMDPPAVVAPEPTPLRRGESVVCPMRGCVAPVGRSCVYVRGPHRGQFCAPHQVRLDAERPPRHRVVLEVAEPTTTGADPAEPPRMDFFCGPGHTISAPVDHPDAPLPTDREAE